MTTFRELQHRSEIIKANLQTYSELPLDIVENIIQYAKVLTPPFSESITENIFKTQMSEQFDFTDNYILSRMMRILRSKQFQKYFSQHYDLKNACSLEEFCFCVCTFLTDNQDLKINWVFAIYDANEDDALNRQDLHSLLRPCILHSEDMEFDEATRDLVDIVMGVVDRNKNSEIELEEFRYLVKGNVLYIDLLGRCIPQDAVVQKFRAKIENKTPTQVLAFFRKECQASMITAPSLKEQPLYPVVLELP